MSAIRLPDGYYINSEKVAYARYVADLEESNIGKLVVRLNCYGMLQPIIVKCSSYEADSILYQMMHAKESE